MASLPNPTIGKYEIIEIIGEGGMGVVYKARDPQIGRMVAIKKITADFGKDSDLLKRFLSEAQAIGRLQHPSIVVIYDLGDDGGSPFLVMEYLTGQSLEKVLASRTELPLIQKLDIIIQVCDALHCAHQRNIVHRDIKPANVILLEDGKAKLVDFGIAHAADSGLTRTGQILGTISYMSPEQLNGLPVDGRSDVFSTGVMLYQLLAYNLPFGGQGTAAVINNILQHPPTPLSRYIRDYPAELDQILDRALAKDREQRYATAEDFAFDLSHVQDVLKRDAINSYVGQARACIAKSELPPAREMLSRALKLDTQNSVAKQLMYEVQRLAEREQTARRIQQLRTQVEEALAQKRHADALELIDQAVQLDKTDMELLSLRSQIQQAESLHQQVLKLLHLAESVQQAGELSMAMGVVEEALQLDPNDTQVKLLHASLVQQVSDHDKQKQLRDLLSAIHHEISARHFTAAHEMIQQAEAVDPGNCEIKSLQDLVATVRQQEVRRGEIQSLCAEVESLIASGDLAGACAKADQAGERFSGEPALIQLKAAAENQRDAAERTRYIEAQIAEANQLLSHGNADDALRALQRACQRYADDSRLRSALEAVRTRAGQDKTEQLKKLCLQKAKEEIGHGDYDNARLTLEMAGQQLQSDSEVASLLDEVRGKATENTREKRIETICRQGQILVQDGEFDRAISLLERSVTEIADPRLENLQQQAKAKAEEFKAKANLAAEQARQMLQEGKVDETLTFLLAQPGTFGRVQAFAETCELARLQHERTMMTDVPTTTPEPAVPESSTEMREPTTQPAPSSETAAWSAPPEQETARTAPMSADKPVAETALPVSARPQVSEAATTPARLRTQSTAGLRHGAVAAIAVVLAILLAAYFLHHRSTPTPSALVPDSYLEVVAQPWGTVKSLTRADGKVITVNEPTPVRVQLPAGEYTITMASPNAQEHTGQISVSPGKPAQYNYVFEAVDAAKIVSSY